MIHIDLHDDRTGTQVRVGSLEAFADKFIAEVGSVTWTFTDKTHSRKAKEAIIRVFQQAWDNR